jgi:hypothetical protein
MRRLTASLTVIALLIAAPAASAKEVSRAEVCGLENCAKFSKRSAGPELQALAEGGDIVAPPANGAPYFLVRVEIRGDGAFDRFTNHWVPSLNLIRGEQGTWMRMPAEGKAVLARLVADLEPRAAVTLPLSASPDSLAMARAAADTAAAATPAAPANEDGGGLAWPWFAIAVAAAALLVAIVVRRHRARPADGYGAAAGA